MRKLKDFLPKVNGQEPLERVTAMPPPKPEESILLKIPKPHDIVAFISADVENILPFIDSH